VTTAAANFGRESRLAVGRANGLLNMGYGVRFSVLGIGANSMLPYQSDHEEERFWRIFLKLRRLKLSEHAATRSRPDRIQDVARVMRHLRVAMCS
jgi:hypothetical protein